MGIEAELPLQLQRYLSDAGATDLAVVVEPRVGRTIGLLGLSLIHGLLTEHRREQLTLIRVLDQVDNGPLVDVVGTLGTESTFVLWPGMSPVIELPAALVSERWEDLWYPSSDDLLVLSPGVNKFVYINHEEWMTWGNLPHR